MRMIEVDDQVFAELQERAEPLVDDANTVLRHLLGLDAAGDGEKADPPEGSDDSGRGPIPHRRDPAVPLPYSGPWRPWPGVSWPGVPWPNPIVPVPYRSAPHYMATPDATARPPNSGLPPRPCSADAPAGRAPRARRGQSLPIAEFELPVLESLIEMGGSGPTETAVGLVGQKLEPMLKKIDYEPLQSGRARWTNGAVFARLDLKKLGQIAADSPRGIWEITEAGRARVALAQDAPTAA